MEKEKEGKGEAIQNMEKAWEKRERRGREGEGSEKGWRVPKR